MYSLFYAVVTGSFDAPKSGAKIRKIFDTGKKIVIFLSIKSMILSKWGF